MLGVFVVLFDDRGTVSDRPGEFVNVVNVVNVVVEAEPETTKAVAESVVFPIDAAGQSDAFDFPVVAVFHELSVLGIETLGWTDGPVRFRPRFEPGCGLVSMTIRYLARSYPSHLNDKISISKTGWSQVLKRRKSVHDVLPVPLGRTCRDPRRAPEFVSAGHKACDPFQGFDDLNRQVKRVKADRECVDSSAVSGGFARWAFANDGTPF